MKNILFLGGSQDMKIKNVDESYNKFTTIHVGNEVIDFPGEPCPAKRPEKVKRELYIKYKIMIPEIYVLEGKDPNNVFNDMISNLLKEHDEKVEQKIAKDTAKKANAEQSKEERKVNGKKAEYSSKTK